MSISDNLQGIIRDNNIALQDLGWHVENDDTSISLHKVRKNGVPLKGATVYISYEEEIYDYSVINDKGDIEHLGKTKKRPWRVTGVGRSTITFTEFNKALDKFLEFAHSISST